MFFHLTSLILNHSAHSDLTHFDGVSLCPSDPLASVSAANFSSRVRSVSSAMAKGEKALGWANGPTSEKRV